jgi:hypothetical protein
MNRAQIIIGSSLIAWGMISLIACRLFAGL